MTPVFLADGWVVQKTFMVGQRFATYAVATHEDGRRVVGPHVPFGFEGAAIKAVEDKIKNLQPVELVVRCKGFSGEGVRDNKVKVDVDGEVRIFDSVAGHYVVPHCFSAQTKRRIRSLVQW